MSIRQSFENVSLNSDALSGKAEKEVFSTPEKIELASYYNKTDLEKVGHLGFVSGLAPFLRGPYGSMYAIRPWTIRQYAGFSTAEESTGGTWQQAKKVFPLPLTWQPTADTIQTTSA